MLMSTCLGISLLIQEMYNCFSLHRLRQSFKVAIVKISPGGVNSWLTDPSIHRKANDKKGKSIQMKASQCR